MRVALFLIACSGLSACATIVNGSNQSMTVSTDPPGAACELSRGTETLGAVALTPGSVRISKSKDDMQVVCRKAGFQDATQASTPNFGGATFGNIIAGGVVGVVVDAATGANYTYPSAIRLTMVPEPPHLAAAPTAAIIVPAVASVPVPAVSRAIGG
ncbi:hypothetical protein [Lichenicola sp.]|uniref:hypothetical protein n=1 Tax=Lichenicola sp. TaxID=2804529 RepID=UPI003AFFEB0C